MNWNGKRVLITGAGGFIGSHLVEEMLQRNCKIRAFVHYNSFNRWGWLDFLPDALRKNIEVYSGDIRDPHGVKSAMKEIDVVFHLAALIGIPYSYHSPDVYLDTNIRGTLNILQAGRDSGVERIIHTSTSEIYGTAQFVPITEEHPVNPQSPYAATKSGADFLASTFFRSFGTPVVIIRPFNTYGPRQSARAIIPTIITQILGGDTKIKLGSLTPTRDLNYVEDTVTGFIRAGESDNILGETINLGTNREIAIGDLAMKIAEIIGIKVKISSTKERVRPLKSEVERLLADNKKAKRLLNWSPETSLEEGLKRTIEWFREPGNLRFYKPDLYNI
ncbi:MAG: NAD-dependent 4,6-dehydratase LegB [Bacteroidetes bacterium]|nr:NAD-dependent 4,6-dehydratase LegB [Bacteroidota bacterium]